MPRLIPGTIRALPASAVAGAAELPLRRLALAVPRVRVTRRSLRIVLGLLWLLDGVLQLQPFMLRTRAGVADRRKFVLKKGSTGKYHFSLVAADGQVVATSPSYEYKQSALDAIEASDGRVGF